MRSNYFAVKHEPGFRFFCRRWKLKPIKNDQGLHGFYREDSVGWGRCESDFDEEIEDEPLVDASVYGAFSEELANLLAYENVAVVMEIDHDKLRYLIGTAWAINSKHEKRRVDLDDIYDLAKGLGGFITTASY